MAPLGVLQVDFVYVPNVGDVDHCDTFPHPVHPVVVWGLTFAMCKSGQLTKEVRQELQKCVHYLVNVKKCSAITGNCGFMIHFQQEVSDLTDVPVFLSSLVQLPTLLCCSNREAKFIMITANSCSAQLINTVCGIDRYIDRLYILGCESIESCSGVERGETLNLDLLGPELLQEVKLLIQRDASITSIILECTELPSIANVLRQKTGLAVYDIVTCCNYFMGCIIPPSNATLPAQNAPSAKMVRPLDASRDRPTTVCPSRSRRSSRSSRANLQKLTKAARGLNQH